MGTIYSVSVHNPASNQTDFLWDGKRLNEKEVTKALLTYLTQIPFTELLVCIISKTISDEVTYVYTHSEIKCEYHTNDGRFYNWCGDLTKFGGSPHNITSNLNDCLVITEEHLAKVIENNRPCRVITQKGELKVFQILPKEKCILTECGEQYLLTSCPIRDMGSKYSLSA